MGCIYNEKVQRNVKPLFTLLLLFGGSLMLLSLYVKDRGWGQEANNFLDLLLTLLFLLAGYGVLEKGRETYRYSIIGEELIIHRIGQGANELVARVKLSKIHRLHEPKRKTILQGVLSKNYCRSIAGGCLCEYQEQGSRKSFYFSPSPSLLLKIKEGLQAS